MIDTELDPDIDALPWLEARGIAAELAREARTPRIDRLARELLAQRREGE
jgi:hypothetical protein